MRMYEKCRLGVQRRQFRKSRDADGDVITYASSFNNGLVRVFRDQLAAQVCNHCCRGFPGSPAAFTTDSSCAASKFFNNFSSLFTWPPPFLKPPSADSKAT